MKLSCVGPWPGGLGGLWASKGGLGWKSPAVGQFSLPTHPQSQDAGGYVNQKLPLV